MHEFPPPPDLGFDLVFVAGLVVIILMYKLARRDPGTEWSIFGWAIVSGFCFFAVGSPAVELMVHCVLLLVAALVALIAHVFAVMSVTRKEKPVFFAILSGWFFWFLGCCVLFSPGGTAIEAARRTQCKYNLKQLGLALHNYHDTYERFPAAAMGAPAVSWRIQLLPFLEDRTLPQPYDHNAAWDDPQNTPLQKYRCATFDCPSRENNFDSQQRFLTAYLAPTGNGTIFDRDEGTQFKEITDGSSNTIAIVEACGTNVVWTDPRDQNVKRHEFSVNGPGQVVGQSASIVSSYHHNGAQVMLADGSVRFVGNQTDEKILRALPTRAGDEDIGDW